MWQKFAEDHRQTIDKLVIIVKVIWNVVKFRLVNLIKTFKKIAPMFAKEMSELW